MRRRTALTLGAGAVFGPTTLWAGSQTTIERVGNYAQVPHKPEEINLKDEQPSPDSGVELVVTDSSGIEQMTDKKGSMETFGTDTNWDKHGVVFFQFRQRTADIELLHFPREDISRTGIDSMELTVETEPWGEVPTELSERSHVDFTVAVEFTKPRWFVPENVTFDVRGPSYLTADQLP